MHFGWVAIAVFGGCVAEQETQIETARRSDEQTVHEYAVAHMVQPACSWASAAPGQPTMPGMQPATVGAVHVQQACGLVVVEINNPEAISRFASVVCANLNHDACSQRFVQMFFARLDQRYTYANWAWVKQQCTAYPVECAQWANVENWALQSHNATLVQWAQQSYRDRNAQAVEQLNTVYRQQNQQAAAFFQAAAAGLSQPTVNCTSTTTGNTVDTTCR